jgi:L-ascorbate metabolism protein UlaG (beta-lactamase superfamily)
LALSLENAVIAASYIQSKFIVPMHTWSWAKALEEMIEFARCVLLENYAVPKVLRPGQAIVLQ